MGKVMGELSVYFDGQFRVGIFELYQNGEISAAKVTFGAEPKNFEVWEYVLGNYFRLNFSPAVEGVIKTPRKIPNEFGAR